MLAPPGAACSPYFSSQLLFSAALYSHDPAGTVKVPCQTSSAPSYVRCVAAQSGCQSPGQPRAACNEPAIVTDDGAAVAPATKTSVSAAKTAIHLLFIAPPL